LYVFVFVHGKDVSGHLYVQKSANQLYLFRLFRSKMCEESVFDGL
jgi:hypothetical protein